MDGFYKEAQIKTVDEPYLKPISDEGIGFYNMDINTAILTFQVLRQGYPLEISKANTEITAYFVSDNGSSTGRVNVDYVNPMKGIIRLTLDNDFLKAATDTWVTGQIYIKAVGRKDTVVLNEFRFRVADALINQIDADIKIRYIREIDDLVDLVKDRIETISKELDDAQNAEEDFLTFVNNQKADFIKQVNDIKNDMTTLSDQTQVELTDYIKEINDKINETNEKLNDVTNGYVTDNNINTYLDKYPTKDEVDSEMKTKMDATDFASFSTNINDIIQKRIDDSIAKLSFQQFALTDENGFATRKDNVDLATMSDIDKSGFYYLYNPVNSPDKDNQSGYALVIARSDSYKKVLFMPYNKHKIYSRNMMGETTKWGSWYDATSNIAIPGTNPNI